MPGVCGAPGEVYHDARPDNKIFGHSGGLYCDGVEVARGQAQEHSGRGQENEERELCSCKSALAAHRKDECGMPYYSTSPTVLPTPANGSDNGSEQQQPELRLDGPPVTGMPRGAGLVDSASEQMEWQESGVSVGGHDHRIGRLSDRLGSSLRGCSDGRPVVENRGDVAHQLSGVAGGDAGSEVLCQEQDGHSGAAQDGQHDSGVVCEPPWRNCVQRISGAHQGPVVLVSMAENQPTGATPAGCSERHSRCRVQDSDGSDGLDAGQGCVLPAESPLGPTVGGPVCLQADMPVRSVLQLEAGPMCSSHRCLSPRLERVEGVCQPALESGGQSADEGSDREGHSGSGGPSVEGTVVVPDVTGDGDGLAEVVSVADTGNLLEQHGGASTSRLARVRERCVEHNLSEGACSLVEDAWRSRMNKSYNSLFGKWSSWCGVRGADPFSGPAVNVANFLAELFEEGYSYCSLNSYRSAISSVHDKVNGVSVGQHEMVKKVLKGSFHRRPPLPKYSGAWDTGLVLNHIRNMGPNESLSLRWLTIKTATLMALTRPSRSADLANLDVNALRWLDDGVSFVPTALSKKSRQGKPFHVFFFPSFQEEILLCPVDALKEYIRRSEPLRVQSSSRLFLGMVAPHKPVVPCTVARWLKTMMKASGVDTSVFASHSFRGAMWNADLHNTFSIHKDTN